MEKVAEDKPQESMKQHHGVCPVFVVLALLQICYLASLHQLKHCHAQIKMLR